MNQTLTEHHIAQYNILLIEDRTVNQTVNYNQLWQLYMFLMYLLQPDSIYSSHGIQ